MLKLGLTLHYNHITSYILFMLKKIGFSIVCFSVLCFSCKKETPNIVFSNIEITTPTNKIVEINIPKATNNHAISKAINTELLSHVKTLLDGENQDKEQADTIEGSINAFNDNYNSFIKDFPNTPQLWEAQIDGEILFQSSQLISISVTSYFNTGGAHGMLYIAFLNFNAKTGSLIKNEQLFNNKPAFEVFAETYFNKAIEGKDIFDPNNFTLPENIGYTTDGLVLLYNPYEIAPYATGIIEFTIPFKDCSDFLVFNSMY